MYLHLKESTIKLSEVVAITQTVIPATVHTEAYAAMAVYLKGVTQPLVHTYETEEERNEIFEKFRDALDEFTTKCCESDN